MHEYAPPTRRAAVSIFTEYFQQLRILPAQNHHFIDGIAFGHGNAKRRDMVGPILSDHQQCMGEVVGSINVLMRIQRNFGFVFC